MTVEASGIAVAIMAGLYLKVPVVFAKKAKPLTMSDAYNAEVFSFTKQKSYNISVSKRFLASDDRVLIIDDFLAHGNASEGLVFIVENEGRGRKSLVLVFSLKKVFKKVGKGYRWTWLDCDCFGNFLEMASILRISFRYSFRRIGY